MADWKGTWGKMAARFSFTPKYKQITTLYSYTIPLAPILNTLSNASYKEWHCLSLCGVLTM